MAHRSDRPSRVCKPARALLTLVAAASMSLPLAAQLPLPDATVGAALQNLASRSAVAFTGRVIRIDRHDGFVAITFTVEETLVGNPGAAYTLREWAGLWQGAPRYRLGAHLAIFLNAPGRSGLSSPVDGMDGIVPLLQQNAQSPLLLDVRRLAARLQRPVGHPLADESNGGISLAETEALLASRSPRPPFEPIQVPLPLPIVHSIPVPLGILHDDILLPAGVAR